MTPIDKARRAIEEALKKLPPEQDLSNLTIEQLAFIMQELISHELNARDAAIKKRKKKRADTRWKWVQRASYIIGPLVGLAIAGKACGLY